MKTTHIVTRGERNNNPLNIRHSSRFRWDGERPYPDNQGFAVFANLDKGIEACFKLLRSYWHGHKLRSVREMLYRWAPPSENHTETYLQFVCDNAMLNPEDELHYKSEKALRLVMAMAVYESKMLLSEDQVRACQKRIV